MKTIGLRGAVLILALCFSVLLMAACGETPVTLTVIDKNTSTEVETTVGAVVSDVLKNAGITLSDKDETVPSADKQITAETTEITVKRYAKVTVKFADDEKTVELVGGKVEDAIREAGFDGDDLECDADKNAYLDDEMVITLSKELKVTLTADGKTEDFLTKAVTVEEFIKEHEVTLGADDEISEKLDAKLETGMNIVIKRIEYKKITEKEEIDFKSEKNYNAGMDSGTSEVTQKGVKGEKTVTYNVKYVDGKEDSREKLDEKVTKKPINEIVTYGTKETSSAQPPVSSEEPLPDGIISKEPVYDCDGSGHGYYIITYADGRVEYEVF